MPGAAGSLLQLLEAAGCGALLDVDRLPRPDGVSRDRWLRTFPSFGFLLAATPEHADAARAVFTERGLACEACGEFEDSRRLDLQSGAGRATVWDFDIAPLTGLGGRQLSRDRHRLVLDAEHRRRVAVAVPAEPLEEADVRHLNLRDHQLAAELAGGAHGEAHEHRAELQRAVGGQDGEPVALPEPVVVKRVQAHRAGDLVARAADRVQRRRIVVARVAVVEHEEVLRHDEHAAPDREVGGQLRRRRAPAAHAATWRSSGSLDGAELKMATVLLLLEDSLPRRQARAGLAARAARGGVGMVEAGLGEHRRHAAVDRRDVVGIGRRRVLQQRPRHRPDRHDKRIDAHLDGAPAALLDELGPLAHAEDHVRRDAPAAEDLDGLLPRAEVALDAALRLAGGDAREHVGVEGLDVDADGVDARAVHVVDHRQLVGRLELHLDGHAAGVLDRRRAARDVQRAAVAAVDRARRQRRVDRPVELVRGAADLGELRRGLDRDRLLAARQLDAAEAALLVRAPVDALLHDGRGDRVEMQERDLPVRDPVRRLHVVDLRATRQPDDADELLLAKQRGFRTVEAQRVRRAADVLGVLGHRQRQPADIHKQRVGRARAAAAALRAVAADDAHAEGLQLDEQPAVVERQGRRR